MGHRTAIMQALPARTKPSGSGCGPPEMLGPLQIQPLEAGGEALPAAGTRCRRHSTAMVSKSTDDFPDPETPVNTVGRPFGMRRVTSLRLFSLQLGGIPDSFWPGFL